MLQAIQDWWAGIAGTGVAATILGYFGVSTVKKVDRLERDKADRSEVMRVLDLMEKRDEQYRQDQKDASESRRRLHDKFDGYAKNQEELNREFVRHMGRFNGRHNGV